MDELTARPPGILASIRNWVERSLGVGLPVYSSSGGVPASPSYSAEASMAAMIANPWVWACVHAIVTDLCGLPFVAETGVGIARTQTYDHWLLQLLARPSPKVGGLRFRRQLVTDLCFGNAYVRVWRDPDGRPVQLGRIPPGLIEAIVGADGEELGWSLPATGQTLKWDEVLHIADPSWEHRAQLVFGDSPIQPLALGLSVDRDTRKQSGRAARRGRLEMMLTPDAPEVVMNKDATKALADQYAEATEAGHGLYVVNKSMKATPLTLTAREGEFLGITDRLRAEILAVFGVPPVRAGEPAANYGTAKQQMRTYWETLQGRAALIDDELSRLAEPGVRIRHSFANVEALQTSRTERQARAVVWKNEFGMSASDAAAYEDFGDAPVNDEAAAVKPSASPIPTNDPTVDEPREDKAVVLVGTLVLLAGLHEARPDSDCSVLATAMIREQLVALGAVRELAEVVAREAAALCQEAALLATEPLIDLRAFGLDHARRIAHIAGVA